MLSIRSLTEKDDSRASDQQPNILSCVRLSELIRSAPLICRLSYAPNVFGKNLL